MHIILGGIVMKIKHESIKKSCGLTIYVRGNSAQAEVPVTHLSSLLRDEISEERDNHSHIEKFGYLQSTT
ncbi:23270_t:CDS:2 [Rhizophagus irregularis]|nr:23270_t:CDS:2 [Rhizophagus irregularis]